MTKYYKKITILEGIYLQDKELFLKKDLSKYFKIDFYFDGKLISELPELNFEINGKNNEIKGDEFKNIKLFLKELLLKKEFQNICLDGNFICYNPFEKNLINRIYNIEKIFFDKIKESIKELKKDDIFQIDFIDDTNFTITRDFNFESFFADHESLFDKNNDFEHSKNRKLYHGLKNKENNKIDNLETFIKYAHEKNKFYIEIEFQKGLLDEKIYEIEGEKKYEYVFILERGNYLVHKKNNG